MDHNEVCISILSQVQIEYSIPKMALFNNINKLHWLFNFSFYLDDALEQSVYVVCD